MTSAEYLPAVPRSRALHPRLHPSHSPWAPPPRYSEAIGLARGKAEGIHKILSNRSLAYFRAQRYSDALRDADAAVALAPHWDKAHFRRAAALVGLKRTLEAARSYREAWVTSKGRCDEGGFCGCGCLWSRVFGRQSQCNKPSLSNTRWEGIAHALHAGDAECERQLWGCVRLLTREQLGQGIIQLLADLEVRWGRAPWRS